MSDVGQPEISVIIVNYGTADLAAEAVESVLARDHGGRMVDVHLVDNASPGDDATRLAEIHAERDWGDRVTLYLETTNHGFGRGNNLVLRALARRPNPPGKVLLLNPDARLKNEAIAVLADFLDAHSRAGFAGGRIEKPNGQPVTSAFRFPSLISVFSSAFNFGPVAKLLSGWQVSLDPALPTSRVDWVSGAAVMARFEAISDVGFFDPTYFLYHEEVDLMHQAAKAGWETWSVTDAEFTHAAGISTGVRSHEGRRRRRPRYWYRSWRHYFHKNHGRAYAIGCVAGWMAGVALNHVHSSLRRRPSNAPLNFFQDAWAVVSRPLLGLPEGEGHYGRPAENK